MIGKEKVFQRKMTEKNIDGGNVLVWKSIEEKGKCW